MSRQVRAAANPQSTPTVTAEVPALTDWDVTPQQAEMALIMDEIRHLTYGVPSGE
jgi:hypothetical protein